jgi:type VI secretion system protein VasJ
VLGSLRSKSREEWQWGAYGKHPAARDYFGVGQSSPLMKGFSEWVEAGHSMMTSRGERNDGTVSWRFWARGPREGDLICGVVRDSSDGLGRPYPLLVLGTGPLDDWENHWELMPFACERTWTQMEYFSTRCYGDLKGLEAELKFMRQPASEWPEFADQMANLTHSCASPDIAGDLSSPSPTTAGVDALTSTLSGRDEGLVPIDESLYHDQFTFIVWWHSLLKTKSGSVPNFIFVGGDLKESFIFFLKRPVKPSDFVYMWSSSPHEVRENGSAVVVEET